MGNTDVQKLLLDSLAAQAEPIRGLRVLFWGGSGRGFPGGDGVAEALETLPKVGVHMVHSTDLDPDVHDKLAQSYDVSIVCNMRVGVVLQAPPRLWSAAKRTAYWAWDLRPGSHGAPLRGHVSHAFLSYNGPWTSPEGIPYNPLQWAQALDCRVGYAPQGSPLRAPQRSADGPRLLFVGDVANKTYHRGRERICRELGVTVVNAKQRSDRLRIEGQLPSLYPSARYVLSTSPLAPGYTSVRTYSILACGGLMLLHRFPGCESLFTDGENAILFSTTAEAKGKLAALDENEPERMRIAENGRRLHAANHTVSHRVISICRQMLEC